MKRALFVFAALATLAVPAWAASGAELRVMPLPAEVRAGQTVELQWSSAPFEVEELEILLSLDDGETWRVRVSPEIEAGVSHYRWRVPDLPAERARLMVRAGDDRGREWEGPAGEAFRIIGSGRPGELEPPLVERGWWFSLYAPPEAEPQDLGQGGSPWIEAGSAPWSGVPLPVSPVLEAPACAREREAVAPHAAAPRGGANPVHLSRLLVVPLRN